MIKRAILISAVLLSGCAHYYKGTSVGGFHNTETGDTTMSVLFHIERGNYPGDDR